MVKRDERIEVLQGMVDERDEYVAVLKDRVDEREKWSAELQGRLAERHKQFSMILVPNRDADLELKVTRDSNS